MVTILMAAYNGEKYIGQQIESILGQTYEDWKLIVRDDGSSDETWDVVNRYALKYPDRIRLLPRGENSGSAANNFFMLMPMADGEYVMFSDGDDVWLPEKIRVTLDKMHEIECKVSTDLPILVHTDLMVVDSCLNCVSKSMFGFQKLDPTRNGLNHLLVQNIVSGCTVMVNRKLIDMAGTKPANAVMHDWWLALIAAACGQIGFVPEPTILYRQHANNAVGARRVSGLAYVVKRLAFVPALRKDLMALFQQASDFLGHYQSDMAPPMIEILQDFISVPSLGILSRYRIFHRHDIWKNGFLRKAGQLLLSRA